MKIKKIFFVQLLLYVLDSSCVFDRLICKRKQKIHTEIDSNPEATVVEIEHAPINRINSIQRIDMSNLNPRIEECKVVFCTGITIGVVTGVLAVEFFRSIFTE